MAAEFSDLLAVLGDLQLSDRLGCREQALVREARRLTIELSGTHLLVQPIPAATPPLQALSEVAASGGDGMPQDLSAPAMSLASSPSDKQSEQRMLFETGRRLFEKSRQEMEGACRHG